ncbi:4-hydroxy-4-methyl-2-oxoglutarate aldolase [Halorubrum aquaticum]|uniref:4-hydroxy-4-methyl-2-oxoglutarate aldolase n=1 Tax=Halorubrum aquaticum TaxID=387340 RepID=A0A1I3B8B8_9EURY|nr:4-carboxy-4-hydroxy-2-oxoadipate aldolase/oxaloacetate decarboxylase [Halorubrum aquaticum]SFH58547.1 4-hydroxy-4-methyl-2-oxoglutarate aldolase [Halorubrum aquaticum]
MVVVKDFERPDGETIDALAASDSASVHEALGERTAMDPEIGPINDEVTVCGPACTVRVPPGDNAMVHLASDLAEPGDVLVVATESKRAAVWGELLTRNARRRGLGGVVTDGNVRDTDHLAESEFPVFSAAVSQAGAVKETPGSVNVPVSVGGVAVRPGDVVVGDADGVTVVPRETADATAAAAADVADHEATLRERIDDGETLADLLGVHELIEDAGVRVVDSPDDV